MFKTARLILKFNQFLEARGVGILALDSPTKAAICLAATDQEKKNKKLYKSIRRSMAFGNRHLAPSSLLYVSAEDDINYAAQLTAYAVLGPTRVQGASVTDNVSACKQMVDECVANLDSDSFETKAFSLIVGSRPTLHKEFDAILKETMKRRERTSL